MQIVDAHLHVEAVLEEADDFIQRFAFEDDVAGFVECFFHFQRRRLGLGFARHRSGGRRLDHAFAFLLAA